MDIDLNQLAQLISIAEQADIDELEVSEGQTSIRITCRHQPCHPQLTHAYAAPNYPQPSSAMPPVLYPQVSKSTRPHTASESAASQSNTSANTTPVSDAASQSDSQGTTIHSPMVGTFYRKSSPDVPAFVEVGQRVAVGDTLCIVEAMKIMHEVKAETAGVIQAILVQDGDTVEYDQPIFTLA